MTSCLTHIGFRCICGLPTGNAKIDVLNRGKGGEEAVEELPRFDADIFDEAPSLLIWQVGTNAVFSQGEIRHR